MKINVLGTEYTIETREIDDDPRLDGYDGYCDDSVKVIALPVHHAEKDDKADLTAVWKKVVRHEIVHAFLSESSLAENSDFAQNEELVDWIAIQGPKIWKAWQEAGAI